MDDSETREERKKAVAPNPITFHTQLYDSEIPLNDDDDDDPMVPNKFASYTAPNSLFNHLPMPSGRDDHSLGFEKPQNIIDEYRMRRSNQVISPQRHDAFASGDKIPKPQTPTFADIMREAAFQKDKQQTLKAIATKTKKKKKKEEEENKAAAAKDKEDLPAQKTRNRRDQSQHHSGAKKAKTGCNWDMPDSTTPGIGIWDATPTPAGMTWDTTPKLSAFATPTPKRQRSRWDLISRIAVVMQQCREEQLMGHLGVVLYEYLGEEYPEVLGSILGALKAIVNVIGMTKMTPPIRDLLPRLTPILKNRHSKVQENCIDLVGRIADRGAEFVPASEWMRICFELLEMLKAHKKGIRRATVNTFGYIAKAIGPQDVLATLLNNLKVQERQNRVCTTVAIAIVAESCSLFTVLPAIMNEYRVPESNVQNGVLKSLSFIFEYVGEMGKDYIYAVTPLLEDALMDRDLVHRQTAASAVKHMALGVAGLGCEDALVHLLNYVWPNIFETSPHVINAVMEAIEGMRVGLGAAVVLNYCLQGLFHPARKVREVYWKIYNSLYIGAQDALVAAYPVFEDKGDNIYSRPELTVFV